MRAEFKQSEELVKSTREGPRLHCSSSMLRQANTYTYEMMLQLDEAILEARWTRTFT